ncbi:MAG TPA: asparagine synthase-related protein [Solirubrobacteraceae bacterium]
MTEAFNPRYRLRPLELLWGMPLGPDERRSPLADRSDHASPRAALEAVVLRALRRPPCLVSFSGGRDSSLVLAIATDVARRHGLPLPVPATNRFPGRPETDESGWQELVVAHLGIADWVRLDWGDELDIVGPYARLALRRHGVLAPFNSHFHLPLIQLARGGSMLTGIGGDELLSPVSREAAAAVLMRRRLPGRTELPALALALAPRPLRTAVIARRRRVFRTFGWLTSTARRRIALAYASWESRDPLRWDVALRSWWWRSRALQCNRAGKAALGRAEDVQMLHPLCEPEVLATAARAWGRSGPAGRQAALVVLGGESLPDALRARRDKAWFDRVFWGEHAHRAARTWTGQGVDPALVNPAGLRREWSRDPATPFVYTLLQAAWLASAPPEMGDEALGSPRQRVQTPGAA